MLKEFRKAKIIWLFFYKYNIYFYEKTMEYIGRIICDNRVDKIDFIEVTKEVVLTKDIPTLIVGWCKVKEFFNNKISILDKKIDENLFWTFSKTEKRVDYETDIINFYKFCLNRIKSNIKYHFFDILTCKLNSIKRLLTFIKSDMKKAIYIECDMVYIYYNGHVMGISLKDCDYFSIKREKILSLIKESPNTFVTHNNDFISFKIKRLIGDDKILITYFFYLKNKNFYQSI